MRYVSVFSGIEAASVAWEPLGWEPMAFSEIEPFPCAVLAERFPDVPNLGDITKVDWSEFVDVHGRPDVVVGGSPCQSFSIAGGRESLGGESRLMFEYIRAVRELRPRWLLWENVPGVLNTRDNAFVQLLDSLQELGYCLAWRVLDAQFFGVAQRRRRVFLVGHLGDGGTPAAVLFESESVSGNTQTSKQKREVLAADARSRAQGADRGVTSFKWWQGAAARSVAAYDDGTSSTITDSCAHVPAVMLGNGCLTPWDVQSRSVFSSDACAPTLNCTDRQSVVYLQDGQNCNAVCMSSGQANAEVTEGGLAPTLTLLHEAPIVIDRAAYNQGKNAQYPPHIEQTELMDSLVARGPHAICAQT